MRNMLPWAEMAKVAAACVVCIGILGTGQMVDMSPVARAVIFSTAYLAGYVYLLRLTGISEINWAISRLVERVCGSFGRSQ